MSDIPDYKILKRLADSCRKAGIKSFKGFGMEFTLSDEPPMSAYKLTKRQKESARTVTTSSDSKFETDSLTEDQLLMWSSNLADEIDGLKDKQ